MRRTSMTVHQVVETYRGMAVWEVMGRSSQKESQSISHFCLSLLELQIHPAFFLLPLPTTSSGEKKKSPKDVLLLLLVVRHFLLPTSIVKTQ